MIEFFDSSFYTGIIIGMNITLVIQALMKAKEVSE